MRVLPPDYAQKLETGVTTLAQAWRITRADGLIVALTQHDADLSFAGTLFLASSGLVPSDHDGEISLAADRTALSGALSTQAITDTDMALGRWNGATVEAFSVDWTNPASYIATWQGQIAGATWHGDGFELDIEGPEAVLARDIGRVYARSCDARLGDVRCQVDMNQGGRRHAVSVVEIVSDRAIKVALPVGKTASDFLAGLICFTSGTIEGWQVGIATIDPSPTHWQINLAQPFPRKPTLGDALTLEMGCDKTFSTCRTRFNNGLNFRGQPTMPGDDVAFGGPDASGNTGGKR